MGAWPSGTNIVYGANNAHNEAQRRKANLDTALINFDDSVQAQVRKAQMAGKPLESSNTILPLKGPTKRG